MYSGEPFFTVVIPTKARPDLIDYALYSLHNQSFDDFSVVITDDYDSLPCEEVVRKYNDKRFMYVVPPKSLDLGMCGNWEYGLNFATGKYVIFIQDKMFMYENSLEILFDFLQEKKHVDIVSWSWDYFLFDNDTDRKSGVLTQRRRTSSFKKWDVFELVKENVSFSNFTYQNKTGAPGAGSPLCSAINRKLYEIIKAKYGKVFDFINPDYGPPIRLLDFASEVYELDDHLTVLMPVRNSEGFIHSQSHEAGVRFLEKSPCGVERLKDALIPGLRSTNSNMVSADYNYSLRTSERFKKMKLCDRFNTVVAIAVQLGYLSYESEYEKMKEKEYFNCEFAKLSKEEQNKLYNILHNRKKDEREKKNWVMSVYHTIVPVKIRNFIYNCRNLEYRAKWFNSPDESIDWGVMIK